MSVYGEAQTLTYTAWDKATDTGKTGDAANHTLSLIRDGVAAAPTNAPAEIAGGEYSLALTEAEKQALSITLRGTSSTADVVIIPVKLTTVKLPTIAPGTANGGLPTLDANSRISANVTAVAAGALAAASFAADFFTAIITAVWTTAANRTLTAFAFAADVRAALGLANANLDAQLAALPTAAQNASAVRIELATELGRIDQAISTRLATASYTAPDNANIVIAAAESAAVNAKITAPRTALLDTLITMIDAGAFTEAAMVNAGGEASLDPDVQAQIDNTEAILVGIQSGTVRVGTMGVQG